MARKIPYIGKEMIRFPAPWLGEGQFEDVCAYFEEVELKGGITQYRAFIRVMDEYQYIGTYATMDTAFVTIDKVKDVITSLLKVIVNEGK
ncbi:hypothetical protein [Escherichia phage Skure]|nr:hypothetical protein [Escherichia phage Skure]QXV79580.1 hypothetical protein bas21_0068 [Escherichia phage GottfriedDienst]